MLHWDENPQKEEQDSVGADQTVSEMVVEPLARQAKALSEATKRPFEEAFAEVLKIPAGRRSASLLMGRTDTRRPQSGRQA